jgi:hypothetical protein
VIDDWEEPSSTVSVVDALSFSLFTVTVYSPGGSSLMLISKLVEVL